MQQKMYVNLLWTNWHLKLPYENVLQNPMEYGICRIFYILNTIIEYSMELAILQILYLPDPIKYSIADS